MPEGKDPARRGASSDGAANDLVRFRRSATSLKKFDKTTHNLTVLVDQGV